MIIKKPVVPEHVCPYIDMAIELVEESKKKRYHLKLSKNTL